MKVSKYESINVVIVMRKTLKMLIQKNLTYSLLGHIIGLVFFFFFLTICGYAWILINLEWLCFIRWLCHIILTHIFQDLMFLHTTLIVIEVHVIYFLVYSSSNWCFWFTRSDLVWLSLTFSFSYSFTIFVWSKVNISFSYFKK